MDLKIYRGTSLLDTKGLHLNGRVYIPGEALESYVGLWNGDTVFLNSPLAGKKICFTVLSPNSFADALPPAVEDFLALCSAAGAQLIYHDGGRYPAGDVLLAIEPGGTQTTVEYLSLNRSLARRLAANLKRGLKLAYLADPVPFRKTQYNLKISLRSRLFTPAAAIQWPDNLDLGPWLFSSLMEYFGRSAGMDGSIFARTATTAESSSDLEATAPETALPEPDSRSVLPAAPKQAGFPEPAQRITPPGEPVQESWTNDELQPKQYSLPDAFEPPAQVRRGKTLPPRSSPCQTAPQNIGPRRSASMSSAQYPDFYAQNRAKKVVKREPFT